MFTVDCIFFHFSYFSPADYDVKYRFDTMTDDNLWFGKTNDVYFGKSHRYEVPFGNCSRRCGHGARKRKLDIVGQTFCCWKCEACDKNAISNETVCESCGQDNIANLTSGQCLPIHLRTIEDVYGKWMRCLQITSVILAMFLLCLLIVTFAYGDKEVFKLSGVNLWYLILLFLVLTLASAYTFSLVPSKIVCTLRNVLPSTILLFTHVIVMLKSIRIHQRFRGTLPIVGRFYDKTIKRNVVPIIGAVFVIIQAVIVANLVMETTGSFYNKDVFKSNFTGETYLIKKCRSSHIQLVYMFHVSVCIIGIVQGCINRKLYNVFYEPMQMLIALGISFILIVMFIAVSFAIGMSEFSGPVTYLKDGISYTFLVADSVVLTIALFVPKCYFVLRGYSDGIPYNGSPNVHRSASFTAVARFQESENIETTRLPMQLDLTSSLPIVGSPTKPVFLRDEY